MYYEDDSRRLGILGGFALGVAFGAGLGLFLGGGGARGSDAVRRARALRSAAAGAAPVPRVGADRRMARRPFRL